MGCCWLKERMFDGLEDRLRSGRVVLPSVVTDLTPRLSLQNRGPRKLARPCRGADPRKCRTPGQFLDPKLLF